MSKTLKAGSSLILAGAFAAALTSASTLTSTNAQAESPKDMEKCYGVSARAEMTAPPVPAQPAKVRPSSISNPTLGNTSRRVPARP